MAGMDFSAEASLSVGASFSAGINLNFSMSDSNLKIISFDSPSDGNPDQMLDTYTVDFNPNNLSVTNQINFQPPATKNQSAGDPVFDSIPPISFTLEFTVDGTGVTKSKIPGSGQKDYVKKNIDKLIKVTGCQINGDIHRPNYLVVLWGNFYMQCVLNNLVIAYTLFDREGSPLRAKITCAFTKRTMPGQQPAEVRPSSPDLTKYKVIKEGDTLPLIAKANYDNGSYYLQLARVNKLKNFRNIPSGLQLVLPPMKDTR